MHEKMCLRVECRLSRSLGEIGIDEGSGIAARHGCEVRFTFGVVGKDMIRSERLVGAEVERAAVGRAVQRTGRSRRVRFGGRRNASWRAASQSQGSLFFKGRERLVAPDRVGCRNRRVCDWLG